MVPRAPSPLDRHSPIDLATMGSCARPRSSVPLADRSTVQSWQVAASPCWNQVLPDVISAHPSSRAWTPTPAARGVHLPVSSSTTSAFPPLGQGRRQQDPCSDFSTVAISGLQSFLYVQARGFARHPGRSYRYGIPQGSRDFYVRASRGSLPPHAPDMLAVRIGQLTAGDSHPIRCAALSAAPLTARWQIGRRPPPIILPEPSFSP